MKYLFSACIFLSFFMYSSLPAQDVIIVTAAKLPLQISSNTDILLDSSDLYTPLNITSSEKFQRSQTNVSVFRMPENKIWARFTLKNNSKNNEFFLSIPYANISYLNFYKQDNTGKLNLISVTGNAYPFWQRQDENVNFNFKLLIAPDSIATYYLYIKSQHPLELPMVINNIDGLYKSNLLQTMIMGIYTGIILSILLYNLFLYFAVKDTNYLVYVLYLILLLFAQLTYAGWSFKFLWPDQPQFNKYAVIITSSLPGIPALLFALFFLRVKIYSRVLVYLFYSLTAMYVFILLSSFYLPVSTSYSLLSYSGIAAGLLALIASAFIAKKGYRPAYYYFIAWFIFALARTTVSLSNLSILSYNGFTAYILYVGSAIEAILLSLALADKINVLQKERNLSQAEAIKVSRENEKLIKEQNIVLEEKVTERTEALQSTNHQLSQTLSDLKDAQTQLVEAEKMASLGQLTAGIAHEINNPINFVKSNIKPLQLDIHDLYTVIDQYDHLHSIKSENLPEQLKTISTFKKDLDLDYVKKEIQNLITGIEEGAERTAEIVRGLRTFSRLDESELKTVNVHEGIDSTLVLLRNNLPGYIKIIRNYKACGNIECFPGKLNQVFMNILNNAIQAINSKKIKNDEEFITITTIDTEDNYIEIHFKDDGIGMTEEVKQKVFEPFFTTKEVGEGTGLGMAIVFKIVEKHHGKINILSTYEKGSEFILTLPHIQSIS